MFGTKTGIYRKKTLKIASYGAVCGCGTTHFTLSVANYYRHKEGLRVLYMDLTSDTLGVSNLRTDDTLMISGISAFRYKGVDFIPGCVMDDLIHVPQNDYDVVILEIHNKADLIHPITEQMDEVYFCGSIKPWKYRGMQEHIHFLISNDRHAGGKYVFAGLTRSEAKLIKDEFSIRAHRMPYIDDPFYLRRESLKELSSLLPTVNM